MKAYHITHWNSVYETAATRQVRVLSYFSKPNKLVGEGLGHMLNQPDGLALYGTWTFLEILASTAPQKHRGWLIRNGSPMDATRMSALTRIPAEQIERALKFFSTSPMDWLEELDWAEPDAGRANSGTPAADQRCGDGTPAADQRCGDGKSVRGKTDKGKREVSEERERENKDGFASKSEARAAQTQQFAAAQARKRELEALTEELAPEQELELKKMRGLVKAIQKKQRGGDFTPVREDEI